MKRTLFGLFAIVVLLAAVTYAQDSGLRTVSGAVVDKGDSPLRDAVIYLKNVRNLTVKTYISNQSGQYRFSGLDPNADYELHAEHNEMTSSTRTISSFDNRKEINATLKVDKDKKSAR